jgi:hypothetical protein
MGLRHGRRDDSTSYRGFEVRIMLDIRRVANFEIGTLASLLKVA